jgi:hypothetical protein
MNRGDQVRVVGHRGTFTLVEETPGVGWYMYRDGRLHAYRLEQIRRKKGRAR